MGFVLRSTDGGAIGNINFPAAGGRPKEAPRLLAGGAYWNKGLMTEAIAAVNDFAFLTLDL